MTIRIEENFLEDGFANDKPLIKNNLFQYTIMPRPLTLPFPFLLTFSMLTLLKNSNRTERVRILHCRS